MLTKTISKKDLGDLGDGASGCVSADIEQIILKKIKIKMM